MERIGSIDKYLEQISEDWKAFSLKENSVEAKSFQTGLTTTLGLLKEIGASKQPGIILLTEKATLAQELTTYANSAEMVNSIKPALEQLDEASGALKLVQDKATYAKTAQAFSAKRKQGGLPLDAFREFILSHNARLTNRLKGTASVSEKNILRQRKDNLKAATERYMGKRSPVRIYP
jgi:hypothetical protein